MFRILNNIKVLTCILLSANYAKAFSNTNSFAESGDTQPSKEEISKVYGNYCQRLLDLEEKFEISDMEYGEAILLHQMISQVSKEPLQYCVLTSMKAQEVRVEE